MNSSIKDKRLIRKKRVRAKIFGTKDKPRISVYRSNRHIFLQLIDDEKGKTLISASDNFDKNIKGKIERAKEVGRILAKMAAERGIKNVVFDRGGYKYHGRVRAAAEGLREGGLKF